jgi:hypothetical protein
MGYTEQPDGSLVFNDDASNPVDDFQRGHDYAKRFAMFRDGARSVRENLSDAQKRDGMEWYETDTKTRWQLIGGEWRQVRSTVRRTRTQPLDVGNNAGAFDFDEATASSPVPDFSYSAGNFTCEIPGEFLVTGLLSMKTAGAEVGFTGRVQLNGQTVTEAANITSTIGSTCVPLLASVSMKVGDVLRMRAYVNLGNPGAGVDVGQGKTYVAITRVG